MVLIQCLCDMISTCEWGRHGGLPLQKRRFVGATLCGCPLARSGTHVENPAHRHLPKEVID
jgi:hypothetical protein